MPVAVIAEIVALALAGVAVIVSAFGVDIGRVIGAIVFGAATSSGIALLVALPTAEWLVGMALIPLTALSAVYLARIIQDAIPGWRGWLAMVVLLIGSAAAWLTVTPTPLTRSVLVGDELPVRTITPGASRPVRG